MNLYFAPGFNVATISAENVYLYIKKDIVRHYLKFVLEKTSDTRGSVLCFDIEFDQWQIIVVLTLFHRGFHIRWLL